MNLFWWHPHSSFQTYGLCIALFLFLGLSSLTLVAQPDLHPGPCPIPLVFNFWMLYCRLGRAHNFFHFTSVFQFGKLTGSDDELYCINPIRESPVHYYYFIFLLRWAQVFFYSHRSFNRYKTSHSYVLLAQILVYARSSRYLGSGIVM